jgi:signal transduction histidine kinase
LSSELPDLTADLRERRLQMIAHGATLLVLVLAGAVLAAPARRDSRETAPSALLAYEEAMGRLRHRGEELQELHAAERRRMEGEMQDKEALARAGELTAGMAHELRNGLGTILGYARLVEHEQTSSEVGDAAKSIRQECETLEAVIRRFMDYVKRDTLNRVAFDVRRMFSRILARDKLGVAQVTIRDGNLGDLWGDEALLEAAFENLIRNAREAAGPGGHVWVESRREGDEVVVRVSDDGPGMSPSVRAELRPFFTTKPGGLGLGLALALKLVRLHGGTLAFGERTPQGLVVTVGIPQRQT